MSSRHSVLGAAVLAAMAGSFALSSPSLAADPAPAPAVHKPVEPRSLAGVEKHLAALKAKFHITDAQKPQWEAFANVMRDNVKQYDDMAKARADKMASLNAVDDLRSFQQLAQAHADGLKKLADAFQGLYDAMTPEQKKNADSVFHDYGQRQIGHKKKA
jgi:protein CpxP